MQINFCVCKKMIVTSMPLIVAIPFPFLFLSIWCAFAHNFLRQTCFIRCIQLLFSPFISFHRTADENKSHIHTICFVEFDLVYFLSCFAASILIHICLLKVITCQHTYVYCVPSIFACVWIQHIFRLVCWHTQHNNNHQHKQNDDYGKNTVKFIAH